jgi:hypothetical protein
LHKETKGTLSHGLSALLLSPFSCRFCHRRRLGARLHRPDGDREPRLCPVGWRLSLRGLAEQAHVAANGAEAGKQSSAKRFVSTGKKLCEAGNERAAAKQFRAALKIAGVAEVQTDSQMASR